jgi:cystine transport system permease protein
MSGSCGGTPLLVQLYIIFYGLPNLGIKLDAIPAAIIAFSLNVGAYTSETLRAAILAVPGRPAGSRVLRGHEF